MKTKQELVELKQEVSEIYRALYRLIEQLKMMAWSRPVSGRFNTILEPKRKKQEPRKPKVKRKSPRGKRHAK